MKDLKLLLSDNKEELVARCIRAREKCLTSVNIKKEKRKFSSAALAAPEHDNDETDATPEGGIPS